MTSVKLNTRVWQDPTYFLAFGFGSGLSPFMPGTCGTLAAIPIFIILSSYSNFFYLTVTFLAFFFGVIITEKVSSDLKIKDYSGIVWDEIVGFLITMFSFPANLKWIIIGFILFRFFDIWKPQPIAFIDKHVNGGMGIMLDDVIAAIFSWIIMRLLFNLS